MISAAVGFQCPECVAEGMRTTRQDRTPYGGRRSLNAAFTSMVLIAINVGIWLLLFLTGGYQSPWYDRLALLPTGRCVPESNPSAYYPGVGEAACQVVTGASWVPGVDDGAWWQLLTSAFTHVDLMHLGFNMLALWFLGPQLELAVGRTRFLAIYLLSALAGSTLVFWLSDPSSATVGASGAVFGLMGALLVVAHKVGGNVQAILMWLGVNLVFTVMGLGWISWQGHLGGLLGGLVAAAIVVYAPKQNRTQVQVAGLVGFGVLLIALVVWRALALN